MPSPSDTKPLLLVLVTGLPGTGKSTVADAAGRKLGAPVLSHDWAMSGLAPYPQLQVALDEIPLGRRVVGWTLLVAMARSHLRRRLPVVLDGVARQPEVDQCRQLAHDEGARLLVVVAECADPAVHRSRVEGRQRNIPNWDELEWDAVERSREGWLGIGRSDLVLDATALLEVNLAALANFLHNAHNVVTER